MKQSFFSRHKWLVAALIAVVVLLVSYFVLRRYLTVQALQKHDYFLQDIIDNNYVGAVLIYILVYVCIIATSLPLVAPLAIAGGFLFGTFTGFLYAELGTTIGSTVAFLILRVFSTTGALQGYRKKLWKLEEKIKKNGVGYLLMLSLLSVVPFFIINTVAVLAGVSVFTVMWTSALGSMPLLFLYALAGSQLRTIGSFKDIFSPQLIIILVLLALIFFVTPKIFRRFKQFPDTD